MYALNGILMGLHQRARTGKGYAFEVSLFDALTEWMSYPAYYTRGRGEPVPRSGARHATIAPYGPFPAGDGGIVMLGLQNEREWRVFCDRVLEQPELADDPRFSSNTSRTAARDALREMIVAAFSAMSSEQVTARLDAAQIANARVNTMADVWRHPQLEARRRWSEVETPSGRVPALLPPNAHDASDARMDPVPRLGAHTDALLAELGVDQATIARLRGEGAL
jgi:itaconate CoA-transferase